MLSSVSPSNLQTITGCVFEASNTQPVIVCRFEGDTLDNMNKIQSIILDKLKEFGNLKIGSH